MRVPADTLFSVGALALAWFVFGLWLMPRKESEVIAEGEGLPQEA